MTILRSALKLGVSAVDLSGGGEPLMTPNIEKIIEFLEKKK